MEEGDNIKIYFKNDTECCRVDSADSGQTKSEGCFDHGNAHAVFIKCCEIGDYLRNYYLLREDLELFRIDIGNIFYFQPDFLS